MKKNIIKFKTIKRNLQKFLAMILLLAIINQLAACSYYQIESIGWQNKEQTKSRMLNYQINNKYIIVDCGKESYHVTDMIIDTVSMTIKCCISAVDTLEHHLYHPDKETNKRYSPGQFEGDSEGEQTVLNEVHIVTSKFTSNADSSAVIPINSIIKIDIISPDSGRTAATYIIGILGGILAILTLIVIDAIQHPFMDGPIFKM